MFKGGLDLTLLKLFLTSLPEEGWVWDAGGKRQPQREAADCGFPEQTVLMALSPGEHLQSSLFCHVSSSHL